MISRRTDRPSLWHPAPAGLFFVAILVATASAAVASSSERQRLAEELAAIDSTIRIADPAKDLLVLSAPLTDHVLPSLALAEFVNTSTILQIPTDLLKVARLLGLRLVIYPGTGCILATVTPAGRTYLLIVSRQAGNGALVAILDRVEVFRGTQALLVRLNDRFVAGDATAVTSFEQLERSFDNQTTVAHLRDAVKRQAQAKLAEPGGFMTIEPQTDQAPILRFYFVETLGQDFIRRFESAKDDWLRLVQLMRDNPAEFALLRHQYRAALQTMDLPLPEEKKRQRIKAFADLFLYMSRNSYCPDAVRYVLLLADEETRGFFVGDFHVHPPGNDVSFQDKENSAGQRVLVLIPRSDGIDLADMEKADPYQPPRLVARYRSATWAAGLAAGSP